MIAFALSEPLKLPHEIIETFLAQDDIELMSAYVDKLSAILSADQHFEALFIHIRNTPNRGASTGAFRHAPNASPSTSRVCAGSMMPSSHSRAVA